MSSSDFLDEYKFNEMIDQAIATAKFAERIHPDFTLIGKGREMLLTKLIRRWQTTEPERRNEVSAVIIASYIMGYQLGFDAAIDALHDYNERRKYV